MLGLPGHARELLLSTALAASGALLLGVLVAGSAPRTRTEPVARAAEPAPGGAWSPPQRVRAALAPEPEPQPSLSEVLEREAEAFAGYARRARLEPEALAREVPELLRAPGPTSAKLALLLALDARESPACEPALAQVLREADAYAAGGAQGLSLPESALRLLERRAGSRPSARSALAAAAWGPERAALAGLRRRAAATYAGLARGPELDRLADRLRGEQDRLLRDGVLSALTTHPEPGRVQALFGDLPLTTSSVNEEP